MILTLPTLPLKKKEYWIKKKTKFHLLIRLRCYTKFFFLRLIIILPSPSLKYPPLKINGIKTFFHVFHEFYVSRSFLTHLQRDSYLSVLRETWQSPNKSILIFFQVLHTIIKTCCNFPIKANFMEKNYHVRC